MPHQIESKNCCHRSCSFRGSGNNIFNRMMNKFERRWFIAIIEEVYCLVWKETSHLYFSAAEQISLILQQKQKQNKKNKTKQKTIWFCRMLFLLLMLQNNFTK